MSKDFFSKIDETRIVEAIRQAELRSRGEIRIHITETAVDDPIKEATVTFEKMGMTATAERNGILIFVAPASRKFAVLGDSGINSLIDAEALTGIASQMSEAFRDSRFTDGLISAVGRAGDFLEAHFPRAQGSPDADELSNEISRG